MINGNTQGIRQSLLAQMETMQEMECDRDTFLPEALMFAMSKYTGLLGREISVYLSRSGSILDISVGDSQTVGLPGVNNRRSLTRLCGVRCIHTHPGGNSTLSGVDLQSLQRLKLDAMAAIGVDAEGRAVSVSAAFLDEPDSEGQYIHKRRCRCDRGDRSRRIRCYGGIRGNHQAPAENKAQP